VRPAQEEAVIYNEKQKNQKNVKIEKDHVIFQDVCPGQDDIQQFSPPSITPGQEDAQSEPECREPSGFFKAVLNTLGFSNLGKPPTSKRLAPFSSVNASVACIVARDASESPTSATSAVPALTKHSAGDVASVTIAIATTAVPALTKHSAGDVASVTIATTAVPALSQPPVRDVAKSHLTSAHVGAAAGSPILCESGSSVPGALVAQMADGPLDRICRVERFEEMTFPALLSQRSREILVTCIVDNGCGLGYLLVPTGQAPPLDTVPYSARAFLAQGDVVDIDSAVEASLIIRGISKAVHLRVMTSSTDEEVSVLLGRSLLDLFNIRTLGGRLVTLGRAILFERGSDQVRRALESGEAALPPDPAVKMEGVVHLDSASARSDSVSLPLSESSKKQIDRLLQVLEGSGSHPLLHAPGSIRLRSVSSVAGCVRDTPEQTHFFELRLKPPERPPEKPHLYAASMMRKLTNAQQGLVAQAVDEYVAAGWWRRTDDVTTLPVSNVFAVPKGPTNVRLVCDMRAVNAMYPSTVMDQPQIPFSLAALRLRRGFVAVGDCRSAFYRVRLADPIPLYVGPLGLYHCDRMCFGLSYGPEGLAASLGALFDIFQRFYSVAGSLYVDDFWINPSRPESLAILLGLLARCGFDVSAAKFQSSNGDGSVEIFGVEVEFKKEDPCSSMTLCDRSAALKECLAVLSSSSRRSTLSKTDVFAIAGKLSYDPVRSHCEGRVIADLLRSLAGAADAADWRTPMKSVDDPLLFDSALDWAIDYLQRELLCPCRHSILLPEGPLCLRVSSDACNSGGSFCVEVRAGDSWTLLYSDAWSWKRQEATYHSNRLEAMTLFRSLRMIANFMTFLLQASPNEEKPSVSICSDSKSAIAWARLGPSAAVAAGYEGRAILRLSKALVEELTHIRGLLDENVSIAHVAGSDNPADAPSRLAERPASRCPSVTIASLIQKRFTRVSKDKSTKKAAKQAEMVRRFQTIDPRRELAEEISRNSFDIFQAVWLCKLMNHLLQCWKLNCRKLRGRARLPFPSPSFSAPDISLFVRSAQGIDPDEQVTTTTRTDFNGNVITSFFIPKTASATAALIAKSAHRTCFHRGSIHTASLIGTVQFPFWIEGRKGVVGRCLANCFRCAVKNQAPPTIGGHGNTFPRRVDLPTFSRISIDVVFMDSRKVLSAMCLDTGFLALLLVESTKISDCVSALNRLANRFGVCIKYIRADRGFKSARLQDAFVSATVSLTTPDTPYTNPVERLHAEARSVVRCEKFLRRCVLTGSDLEVQDTLDRIAAVVNSRPLGRFVDGEREGIITPATLAFGTTFNSDALVELREYFYKIVFAGMRRVFKKNGPQFLVGQRALYFDENCPKTEPKFKLCRIMDWRPPYFEILIIESQWRKIVGRGSLSPLNLPILDEGDAQAPGVSRVGARISSLFQFEGSTQEFTGIVVKDHGEQVQVRWDDKRWRSDELVAWGACRVI
jgi:hypothetical protein